MCIALYRIVVFLPCIVPWVQIVIIIIVIITSSLFGSAVQQCSVDVTKVVVIKRSMCFCSLRL